MLLTILTLILITAVYMICKNTWITIAVSFAIVMILRTLRPIAQAAWQRCFPKLELTRVEQSGMDDPIPGRGVRILVVTQFLTFAPEHLALFQGLVETAAQSLEAEKPLFGVRYRAVLENRLPRGVDAAVCGEKDAGMRKCYHAWLRQIKVRDFGAAWKPDSELFMYDGQFPDPETGRASSAAVLFLFDSRLPRQ